MANTAFRRTFTDLDEAWITLGNEVVRFLEKDLPAYLSTVGIQFQITEKEGASAGPNDRDYTLRFSSGDGTIWNVVFHWHDHRKSSLVMNRPEYRRISGSPLN